MEKKIKETLDQKIARLSAINEDERTKTDNLDLSLARFQVRAAEIKAAIAEIPTKASERTTEEKQKLRELMRERDEIKIETTRIRSSLTAAKSTERLKAIKRNLAAHKTDDLIINLRENGIETENQIKAILRDAARYTNLFARLGAEYGIKSEESLFAVLDPLDTDEDERKEVNEFEQIKNEEAKAEEQNNEENAEETDEDEIQTA